MGGRTRAQGTWLPRPMAWLLVMSGLMAAALGASLLLAREQMDGSRVMSAGGPAIGVPTSFPPLAFLRGDGVPGVRSVGDVFVMDQDGATQQLTAIQGGVNDPTWSSTGGQIAFTHGEDEDGPWGVYVIESDGTGLRQLTNGFDQGLSWSPDDRHIVFDRTRARDARSGLFIVGVDDGRLTRLTHGSDGDPAWSPDGQWIAFVRWDSPDFRIRFHVYVIGSDGAGVRQITFGPVADWEPSWSPDSTRLVFVRESGESSFLVTMSIEGTQRRALLECAPPACIWLGQPAWAPRGNRIAFSMSLKQAGTQIFTIRTDGQDLRQVTQGEDDSCCPSWKA